MTAIQGNDGNVNTWPTAHGGAAQAGLLRNWRCNFTKNVVEVTGFATTLARRHRLGLLMIEGSAVGTLDDAATSDPGVDDIAAGGASIILQVTPTAVAKTFTFTAAMRGISIDVDKNGQTVVTYDFIGGDASDFAEAWA